MCDACNGILSRPMSLYKNIHTLHIVYRHRHFVSTTNDIEILHTYD